MCAAIDMIPVAMTNAKYAGGKSMVAARNRVGWRVVAVMRGGNGIAARWPEPDSTGVCFSSYFSLATSRGINVMRIDPLCNCLNFLVRRNQNWHP